MQDENVLRIKINGQSLLKLSKQHRGRDFIITYPPTIQGENQLESHFSLHTPNNRVTFKTTSIKVNNKEMLPYIISVVKDHPTFSQKVTSRDIDLYRGEKIFDLNNPKEINYMGTIALNLKNSNLEKYFKDSKTPDSKFKKVEDIIIPPQKNDQITIKFCVGKNFSGDLTEWTEKYDKYFTIKDTNHNGDSYLFVFLINFTFPNIEKNNKTPSAKVGNTNVTG